MSTSRSVRRRSRPGTGSSRHRQRRQTFRDNDGGVRSPVRTRLHLPIPCSTGIYREFSRFHPELRVFDQKKWQYISALDGKFPTLANREFNSSNREFAEVSREFFSPNRQKPNCQYFAARSCLQLANSGWILSLIERKALRRRISHYSHLLS